jgi:hypothetical protein
MGPTTCSPYLKAWHLRVDFYALMEKRRTDLATAAIATYLAGHQAVEASSKSFFEHILTFAKLGLNPDFPLGAPKALFAH